MSTTPRKQLLIRLASYVWVDATPALDDESPEEAALRRVIEEHGRSSGPEVVRDESGKRVLRDAPCPEAHLAGRAMPRRSANATPDKPTHLSGFYGDEGESPGVLAISSVPSLELVIVSSPQLSPLIEGYLPNLGGWACSPEAAEMLAEELLAAAKRARLGFAAITGR